MIKPNPKNGTGSKLEPVLKIRYSEMAIPNDHRHTYIQKTITTIKWLRMVSQNCQFMRIFKLVPKRPL